MTRLAHRLSVHVTIVAVAMLAGACTVIPTSIVRQPRTSLPLPVAPAESTPGAIFQANNSRPLFEDRRARQVGDLVVITISEKTSAAKAGGNTGSKTASVAFNSPLAASYGGSMDSSTNNKLEDKAGATSSNNFTGTISVTVIKVLSNGNMVVAGEKQVALDRGTEFIRFSGVISPDMIGAGNVVPSTQVADARIEYRTNSTIDSAEFRSLLTRLYLSQTPF
jgi:flagellar L-ring protein precursor FlgH